MVRHGSGRAICDIVRLVAGGHFYNIGLGAHSETLCDLAKRK